MSTDINTIGQSEVSLSFWWLCQGGAANYGEVYYSTDGGAGWTLITSPIAQYRSQSTWTQQNITLAAFGGQSTLRFGFRFVNGTSIFGAADPGFGVDEIRVVASSAVPTTIATGALDVSSYCAGAAFVLPFSVEGSFAMGNTFTAQLSDANGSFAAAITIGTLASTTAGDINCTLPGIVPTGGGYRVRVVADMPATVGSTIGTDLAMAIPSNAGDDAQVTFCTGAAAVPLISGLGGSPDQCGIWLDPMANPMNGIFLPGISVPGNYTYITDCASPCPADQSTVIVSIENSQSAGADVQAALCSNGAPTTPYAFVDGGATDGSFYYQGSLLQTPIFNVPGIYELEYVVTGTAGCANDTAHFTFAVSAPPNAGVSLSYTLCINAGPLPLLPLLVGAQSGGTWTGPSGASFSGTLDPATDISGLYTYSLEGSAPCVDAQGFVALVIDPCAGIAETQMQAHQVQWLGAQGNVNLFRCSLPLRVLGVQLFDLQGRMVMDRPVDLRGERIELDLGGVRSGVYTIRLLTEKGAAVVKLIQP